MGTAAGPTDPASRPSQGYAELHEVAAFNLVLQNSNFFRFSLTPTWVSGEVFVPKARGHQYFPPLPMHPDP